MERDTRLYLLSELLGNIQTGSRAELLGIASGLIGEGGAIYTPNPVMLYDAMKNSELKDALGRGINIPDGVGVRIALSRLGKPTEVFAGVELGDALLSLFPLRFGIIGGKTGRADAAGKALEKKHPESRCVLALDGYSYGKEKIKAALDISRPDLVFVCLGSPRQEIFIDGLRDEFGKILFLGLGGSVDIYSGAIQRAPKIFRSLGLEWLYRMIKEPRRFLGLPKILKFTLLCLKLRKSPKRIKSPSSQKPS